MKKEKFLEITSDEMKECIIKNFSYYIRNNYYIENVVDVLNGKWIVKLKRK